MSARILHTKLFRREFADCLSRHPVRLRFAVPYVGKTPFGSVVDLCRDVLNRGCQRLQIVTLPPGSRTNVISVGDANLLVALGPEVDLLIRPKLHAKVYYFGFSEGDDASFVGSANLSGGGLVKNDETVALFRAGADNMRVEAELDRMAGPGAFEFGQWKLVGATTEA